MFFEDAESIFDILKIQNGSLIHKGPYFNPWWTNFDDVSVHVEVLENAESIGLERRLLK